VITFDGIVTVKSGAAYFVIYDEITELRNLVDIFSVQYLVG
jgi:hypothetical protein